MSNTTLNTEQGHWLLAKMGKKVLRPGGKKLTIKLIDHLRINDQDDIVEFAPGLGFTAAVALKNNPKSYTGIELNEEAAGALRRIISGKDERIIIGNASESTLQDNCADKVYGEAMLTMQADHRKSDIIREAFRILKKGGRYGIHELSLEPDDLDDEIKRTIQKEIARAVKVNARPLTISEWTNLLEKEGFKIVKVETNTMQLLEPKRMIDDEGFLRTLKIAFNILTHPKERKRILAMRKTFQRYQKHLSAVAIISEKV
ncbi:MAG: methyltransferase domain-containing protein [Bacteroidota bacterium]